jgi:hypothetical protein
MPDGERDRELRPLLPRPIAPIRPIRSLRHRGARSGARAVAGRGRIAPGEPGSQNHGQNDDRGPGHGTVGSHFSPDDRENIAIIPFHRGAPTTPDHGRHLPGSPCGLVTPAGRRDVADRLDDTRRAFSGALVDTQWILTAASCFADNPAASLNVPAGAPKRKTTAVIGRTDLTGTQGADRRIVELVPRTDRDVVLARLNRPVTDVTQVALATSAAAAGEQLTFAGYGRTKTEWAPLKLHTGAYTVDAVGSTGADVTGKDGVTACAGDAGGPVVRGTGASATLAGLTSQSWQGGCFGIDAAETRTGAVVSRVDEAIGTTANAGAVETFSLPGAAGDNDVWIEAGNPASTSGGASTSPAATCTSACRTARRSAPSTPCRGRTSPAAPRPR